MAMYDWNGNGKKDFGDNYIEYNVYRDVTGKSSRPYSKNNTPKQKTAVTTDKKRVNGEDISTIPLILACAVSVIAIILLVTAIKAESTAEEIFFVILSIATAIFGKWLLLSKNIVKKDKQDKYK